MPIISSGQITITDLNDGYTLSITGGNRAFSYASSGTTPAPATSGTFGFTLFRGGVSITPSSYSWTASGVLSGTSATSTFQPTLSNTYSVATPTTVTITVTHQGNSLTTTVSVLVSQAPSNAIIDTIFVSAPAIYKDVADAATTGTYTTTTIQGRRYNGATTSNFGWITVTPNTTGTESARTDTSTTALTLTPTTTSGVSSYIIRLYAAASGGTAVTSQTLNVVFKGAVGSPGNNGTSPVLYELGLSAAVIARSSSNVLAPTSLVVSGFSTTAGTKSAYSGRFKIYEDAVLKYTSSADQTTHTYTPTVATIGIIKTELYAAGGTTILLDTQEVPVVVSGSSAMTFSLTNSAYPIPSDNSGAVATYTGSGTSIQVLEGSEVYTYVTTLGTTAKTFSIGTPTLSVADAITVGARSGATTTTAVVANHSAMSNSVDAVVISYPLTYIRANGATGTQTVTQTVTKVKAGTLGIRGSRQLYSTDVAYVSTYDFDGAGATAAGAASYAARATQLIAAATAGSNPTTPVNGDTVTFTNGTDYVYTITHNGTAWVPPGTIIDGSLLVTGSVTAGKINSNGLTIRDTAGNVILSAGASLAASSLNLPGTVSNVPGGWLNSTINVDGTGKLQGIGTGASTVVNNNYTENSVLHIYRPLGASGSANQPDKAGAIKISLPQGWTNTMMRFYVEIYEYNSKGPSSYNIGGYNYADTAVWINTFATYTGAPENARPVRFGYDANNKCCIWIGDPAGLWQYPQVRIIDFSAGYSNFEEAKWASGWAVTWDTAAATNVTATVTAPTPGGTLSGANAITNSNVSTLVSTNAGLNNNQINVSINSAGAIAATGGPTASGSVSILGLGYIGAMDANKTSVDANGAIQGVASGAGTLVSNALVETLSLVATGGVVVAGNTITRVSGDGNWNSQVYSTDSYVGGAYVKFTPLVSNTYLMVGLNTDPSTDASFGSIDYAFYLNGTFLDIYESSTYIGAFRTTYTTSDVLSITYDGSNIRYYKNGTVLRTVPATITLPLYLDSSFANVGASIGKVSFGPMSSNAWSAITGQPAGIYNSNINVDSTGKLQGIGTGAGTAVSNSNITLSASGALSGAGGGSVTIGGLGYSGALNATFGKSLALPFTSWNLGSQPIVYLSDAKVGSLVLRLFGSSGYPNQGNYIPIDPAKTYRTRFWARPSSNNNAGLLYFSLRQFLDNTGTAGSSNGGRNPYKPGGVSRATHITTYGDTWGEYSFLWTASDWQAGAKFVQPEFLDNYSGTAGFWEIQDFTFEEVTEVTNKLSKSSNDILSATISVNAVTGAGFRAGDLTWDSAGAVTPISGTVAGGNAVYGKGVAMTPGGLIGHNGTKTTFAVNATTGDAIFAGNISGATGTFNGSLAVGTNPAISGNSMTGSGAIINSNGTFALGNTTRNITFNATGMRVNGSIVDISNLIPGASLPDYVRTYKGGVTPTITVNAWMPLQLDPTALNNKLGATDHDAYRTILPAGTYFYELSVPAKCNGSDTNDACYTAIISYPPGTTPGSTQTVCGYVGGGTDPKTGNYIAPTYQCWQEYIPFTPTVLSTAGVNVVGDWQTATIFGVGRFTISTPTYIAAAILTTDGFPSMQVVARSNYSSTILRIWRDTSV